MTKSDKLLRFFHSELWRRSMRVFLLWNAMQATGTMIYFQLRWIPDGDTYGHYATFILFGGLALMCLALRELMYGSKLMPPPQ